MDVVVNKIPVLRTQVELILTESTSGGDNGDS